MSSHLPKLLVAALAGLALVPPAAARADTPTVHATPAQVSHLLFVAGDVQRLARNPSGTVDTVLEKVLQQEYRADPALAPSDAAADIRGLRGALAVNTQTLQTQPGNQRVLSILASLEKSNASPHVQRALAAVADAALTESSAAGTRLGRRFFPEADSVSTLLYGGFSPAATLQDTADLAAGNARFGRARDALWAGTSHESVFDGAMMLLMANPALQSDAVRAVTRGLAADGSLDASLDDVQGLIHDGLQTVGAQTTQAIADHRAIDRACAGGVGCQSARDKAQADGGAARTAITAQLAAVTAAAGLLEPSDRGFAASAMAEAQAAAQVAASVNAYYAAQDYGQYAHLGADVAGLAIGLAAVEIDPAAAISGVLNVVGDVAGVAITGPDANMLILQGLQGVSQQLSAFAQETAAQFAG